MSGPNLSFETAGTEPGFADQWALTMSASVLTESFARADGGESSFEGFEFGWGVDGFVGDLTIPTTAQPMQFGPVPQNTPFDGFEHFWNNDGFLFDLAALASAAFLNHPGALPPNPTTDAFEGFESEWMNSIFFSDLSQTTTITDEWNSTLDAKEGFEREWDSNESFIFDFTSAPPTPAQFNEAGVLGNAETFEAFNPDLPFGIDGNTIVLAASPYHDNDQVTFFPSLFGNSVLPTPLSTKIVYTVASATPTTFTLTLNGNPVVISDPGAGQNWVRGNTAIQWGGINGDLQGEDP